MIQTQQLPLYFLVLFLLSFVLLTALGGGAFYQKGIWIGQWQHRLFTTLCHQDPSRSFWINAQPMAVCSRCFGIYFSLWAGWITLPLSSQWSFLSGQTVRKILIILIFVNLMDVVGNMLEIWENTLYTRWILGMLVGYNTVLLFSGDFFKNTNQKYGDHYARATTNNVQK